ncbi:BON domain-containing protein [Luteolibacter yonseiensis]|uniref:BON domain-containing protein n=1 Tax=Luteolibacter yonseiensis TaxID=1144680 RepID=A0A934VC29_9BACT|nr:BON domain-containing protein [Luteolibacter yonseiensis]MBK1816054.1 BON domain-containing protein [Luteolibacter yonseiensis]
MKPKTSHHPAGQWTALSILVLASAQLSLATPEAAPSGESEVADFIQTDIRADSRLRGAEIDVRIENNIAILTGTANSLAQAERATTRANASEGVLAVSNQVRIKPGKTGDLAARAKAVLAKQKTFTANGVAVTADGSRVLLNGEVGTPDEKDLAREIVSEVPGVLAIENNLTVTYEGIREDSQITEQLHFIIQDDPLYEGLDLVASVKSGTATLSGEVGSRGELDRLIRRSYVTGVTDVQVSNLSINRNLQMEGLVDKNYSREESLAALKGALAADPRIDARTIRSEMADGVITLSGSVRQITESDAVESTARGIPGVLSVSNQLRISNSGTEMATAKREVESASVPVMQASR